MTYCLFVFVFFFNATATTEIYTLSLHDALPISWPVVVLLPTCSGVNSATYDWAGRLVRAGRMALILDSYTPRKVQDRKSTRLNSSHEWISYAVFCLKKKKRKKKKTNT